MGRFDLSDVEDTVATVKLAVLLLSLTVVVDKKPEPVSVAVCGVVVSPKVILLIVGAADLPAFFGPPVT